MDTPTTQYEVVNKLTGEVSIVTDMQSFEGYTQVTIQTVSGFIGVRFEHGEELYQNESFTLREKGTETVLSTEPATTEDVAPEVSPETENATTETVPETPAEEPQGTPAVEPSTQE